MRVAGDVGFSIGFRHRLRFVRNLFGADVAVLREVLAGGERGSRAVVFIDRGVAEHHYELPGQIGAVFSNLDGLELDSAPRVVPGGEIIKNDARQLAEILSAMHAARLCRQSYVIAIGGGAMLDAVGYAAALTHRGVRLVRVPSTTLGQADSGVGVKNGVNAFNQKNYLGAFAVPWAVLNDEALLATLSERDWRCGFAEAVKVALLKDARLFERIERDAGKIAARDEAAALPVIRASAVLHRDHITGGGDPFESGAGRPLDFGHWAAHKLEVLSDYELRHGEAVAIGILLDMEYAAGVGICAAALTGRVRTCLERLGFTLWHEALARENELIDGLEEFRAHLGGPLSITLVREPSCAIEAGNVDLGALRAAIRRLRDRKAAAA